MWGVDRSYADKSPLTFTGTIKKFFFDIKPHLAFEDEQVLYEAMYHLYAAYWMSQ